MLVCHLCTSCLKNKIEKKNKKKKVFEDDEEREEKKNNVFDLNKICEKKTDN